jgi:hypothetical protein
MLNMIKGGAHLCLMNEAVRGEEAKRGPVEHQH